MKKLPGVVFTFFLVTPALPGFADTLSLDQAPASLKTTVLVFNMARVRSKVLGQAEEEATRIFREVGLELEWKECPCSQSAGPGDVILRIIPRLFGSMKAGFRDSDLGFAPTGEEGGVLATIFFHRVEAITKGGPIAPVLGNAIAHELGHLLLGRNAHSADGIMQAHWSRKVLKLASRGSLHFTTEQAQRMRTRVAARIEPQEAAPVPMLAALTREETSHR